MGGVLKIQKKTGNTRLWTKDKFERLSGVSLSLLSEKYLSWLLNYSVQNKQREKLYHIKRNHSSRIVLFNFFLHKFKNLTPVLVSHVIKWRSSPNDCHQLITFLSLIYVLVYSWTLSPIKLDGTQFLSNAYFQEKMKLLSKSKLKFDFMIKI